MRDTGPGFVAVGVAMLAAVTVVGLASLIPSAPSAHRVTPAPAPGPAVTPGGAR